MTPNQEQKGIDENSPRAVIRVYVGSHPQTTLLDACPTKEPMVMNRRLEEIDLARPKAPMIKLLAEAGSA